MTKGTRWVIIVIVIVVTISALLVAYKKSQKINDYCLKISISSFTSTKSVSLETCKKWVRSAGSVEKFKELAKQALEE